MVKKLFGKATGMVSNVKTVSPESVKVAVKDTLVGTVEESVDVVKTGIFGIVNGVLLKIVATVIFIVIVLSAGCVGTNLTINKLTSDKTEIQENK